MIALFNLGAQELLVLLTCFGCFPLVAGGIALLVVFLIRQSKRSRELEGNFQNPDDVTLRESNRGEFKQPPDDRIQ